MDDTRNTLANMNELNGEQTEKVIQLKDLTGFDESNCIRILRENNWDIEVSLNLVFDGRYNANEHIMAGSSGANQSSEVRHRNVATSSNVDESGPSTDSSASTDNEVLPEPQAVTLWNTTMWILKLPFFLAVNTFNTIYDFLLSLVMPRFNYDYNGTIEQYINNFRESYGTVHPAFFRGTLDQALERGKQELRFVLVYLHSPTERDIDAFCSTVLATPTFKDFIDNENLLFWSCCVNYPDGYRASQILRPNSYPHFSLYGIKQHRMVKLRVVEGPTKLIKLVKSIKSALDDNVYSFISARLEREERSMSTIIRAQQDAAFEESLKVDQEKERKRKEEADKKANEERAKKEKEDCELRRKEKILEMKSTLLEKIPSEPHSADSIRIMFKLPNGSRLDRRFLKSSPVKYLYYYVFCHEPHLINFKLRTNFPTRDIAGCSPSPEIDLEDDSPDNELNTPLEKCDILNNTMLFVYDLDS